MDDLTYSFRLNRQTSERQYRLTAEALEWTDERNEKKSIHYGDFHRVRFYKARWLSFLGWGLRRRWRCVLCSRTEKDIFLLPSHYVDARTREGRTGAFHLFIRELTARIRAANPDAAIEMEQPRRAVAGGVFVLLLRIIRRFPLDASTRWCSWIFRTFGPWLPVHRTARRNLILAFPKKAPSELEPIIDGVWDNLGRVFAEWAHLDRLWHPSRIVFDQATRDRFFQIRDSGKPVLFFGAHLANWELPAVAMRTNGLDVAVLFLRPRIIGVADELLRLRTDRVGTLISAERGAAYRVTAAMRSGVSIGMMIDNYPQRARATGIDVMLFGQRTRVSPTLARLARLFDCPIYGGRAVRLEDNRYRLDLSDAIPAPRGPDGRIDVTGTMQMVMWIIEGWIREHPEQWRWIYRWWR